MALGKFSFLGFAFDTRSCVLTRNGHYLRTPRQTALLLGILIEQAGAVVTREEIQNRLWPDGEFVDYEHSINRNINKLRLILRDNSQKSRFIRTFPKRGYCFIAPVVPLEDEEVSAALLSLEAEPAPLTEPHSEETPSAAGKALQIEAPQSDSPPTAEIPSLRRLPAWASSSRLRWGAGLAVAATLLAACLAIFNTTRHKPPENPNTIYLGVAPFEEQGDGANRIGESFRLDLMDTLSQLPSVQLRASHSLENIKHDDASIRALYGQMHLDLLLLGKFIEHGNNCSLQFELVRVSDAVHLASFQYYGSQDELATIRDKVQRDIFATLSVTHTSVQVMRGSTDNSQAYDAYLRARKQAYYRTVESLKESVKEYKVAIAYDPAFARAYAGMATAYLGKYGFTDSIDDLSLAKIAAQKALQLDSELAEAHAVLGINAFRRDWDFSQGERELRYALELEPHQAAYHGWLAQLLVIEGRFDEGLHEVDLAHADDPLWPQVYNIEVAIAAESRNFPRAIDAAQRVVELTPESSYSRNRLAWTFFAARRYDEAIEQWRIMAAMDKDKDRAALEEAGLSAYRKGGVAAYAQVRLDAIVHGHPPGVDRHPNDFIPAEWYAFLRDNDHAITELDKTVAQHDAGSLDLPINSMFDNLHRDPRFLALLARVGLKLPPTTTQETLSASLR